MDAVTLESFPEQHIVTITFDSRHAKYGDREGQALAQVITAHTAKVTVVRDNVISATLDDHWDELTARAMSRRKLICERSDREIKLPSIACNV